MFLGVILHSGEYELLFWGSFAKKYKRFGESRIQFGESETFWQNLIRFGKSETIWQNPRTIWQNPIQFGKIVWVLPDCL